MKGVSAFVGAAAGMILVGVVCIIAASSSSSSTTTSVADFVELESLQDAEKADQQFAGCVNELKGAGMDLVMKVDATCGDVFTASECNVACHAAALELADTMGCCWRPLIAGFSRVQPSAAHAWHSWSFNLENLCGVSLPGQCEAQTYSAQKDVADKALGAAQSTLDKANTQEQRAADAQKRALQAQQQAKKLQHEMKMEERLFKRLRHHFRESRADAARSVIVERMVHNSVKKDLQSAWGIHKQVAHDRSLASKIAAGTQVQQENAEALLKSAHSAKRSVFKMAKMAAKAKRAAFRLHKLALKDLRMANKVQRRAALQRKIARKAAADVKRQLKESEAIIKVSGQQQAKAKKIWGALNDEQSALEAEKKEATEGVDDEEGVDKKMEGEIADAESKFDEFEKDEDAAEAAVAHATELAERAAQISEDSENLLKATQEQQDHIDEERGWITQQEASMMAGRRGIATMEGELDVLRSKYMSLRRAIAGLNYATPYAHTTPAHHHHERYEMNIDNNTPLQSQHARYVVEREEEQPQQTQYVYDGVAPEQQQEYAQQYVYAGMPMEHIILPMPPHSHVEVSADSFQQQEQ